ncbi:VOC family protein [Rhodococcus sp. H29-C3]|uniref:VOC family protein n=1 Tax=Rhodococcus sp. H29-C3 TaxID=3046307 RepID=UPI0024B99400|nr:VOC family protein [Rhodococcus sp. H29-C3]MDJ0363174.1 VOC family protein [Rhodococcus sp. H29-C3]
MTFQHVLAVVPVSDIDRASSWYSSFFGRTADNNPMPVLLEWQVTDHGWVQVIVDDERAGSGMLNLAVDDLERQLAELVTRGVVPGEVVEANKDVRLSTMKDPDGNAITLIGGFRVNY